jgi:hypothetical protein
VPSLFGDGVFVKMKNRRVKRKDPMHLNVPFYRQHYDFTCGPASLMMAMKCFDEHLRLTKNLED